MPAVPSPASTLDRLSTLIPPAAAQMHPAMVGAARMVLPSGSLCEYPPGPQPLFNIYLIRCVSTTAAVPQYARTDVLHHAYRFLCSAPVLAQCETVPTLPRFSWVPPSTLKACPPPASGGVTTLAPCVANPTLPRVWRHRTSPSLPCLSSAVSLRGQCCGRCVSGVGCCSVCGVSGLRRLCS